MSRAEYMEARRVSREMHKTREERGLPHHPDGTGRAGCPDCAGAGEHIVNDTTPCGYGPDPQCDEPVTCARCVGFGWVADGHRDPILDLRALRRERLSRRPVGSFVYGTTLQRVVSSVCLPDIPSPFQPIEWPLAA